tara:strand:+ start:361 stop:516 length:156 start_codon:yes stop_codon:yes gene_type:complete
MWIKYKTASNLMTAEMWKDAFEAEGLTTKILPDGDITSWGERTSYIIYVPK